MLLIHPDSFSAVRLRARLTHLQSCRHLNGGWGSRSHRSLQPPLVFSDRMIAFSHRPARPAGDPSVQSSYHLPRFFPYTATFCPPSQKGNHRKSVSLPCLSANWRIRQPLGRIWKCSRLVGIAFFTCWLRINAQNSLWKALKVLIGRKYK